MTLFRVEDGNIGGIFTPLSWDCNSGWKGDMNTFIFNLNQNRVLKKPEMNIQYIVILIMALLLICSGSLKIIK